jgi:hypothetical protein
VISSVRAMGGSRGPPSGSPLMAAKPDMASASVANPGRSGVGAVLAEAGHPQDHQPRGCGPAARRAEPEALQHAGPEVLDQHVASSDQRQQRLPALVGLEVEGGAALVAAHHLPVGGGAVAGVGRPIVRVESPRPGRSILSTSAPKSAR